MASAAFAHSSGIMISGEGLSVSEAAAILEKFELILVSHPAFFTLSLSTFSFILFLSMILCRLCGGGGFIKGV